MPVSPTDQILEALLETLPEGWWVKQIFLGSTWIASFIENEAGEGRVGLAAMPPGKQVSGQASWQYGFNRFNQPDYPEARTFSRGALAGEPLIAAVGLATLNALLKPDPASLTPLDAGDWLVEQGRGRRVALVGRFPFIDELEPVARKLWVFELDPQPGEFSFVQAPQIIPQAEVLAVTGSALLNHSLQDYLALASPTAKVMVLGPSTPLSPVMFKFGVHLLCGIEVVDEAALLESIAGGLSFRKMSGIRRVSLVRNGS
jgi:uncharacterized protein